MEKIWNALIEDHFKKFGETGDTGAEYAPNERYKCNVPYENYEHIVTHFCHQSQQKKWTKNKMIRFLDLATQISNRT